jgi:UDP-N-acetylmuramyl pentapeptide synthase
MKTFLSLYSYKFPLYFVYMLQQVEYEPLKFLDWVERLFKENKSLASVMHRKSLVYTSKAKALILLSYIIAVSVVSSVTVLAVSEVVIATPIMIFMAALSIPFIVLLTLAFVSWFAYVFLVRPSQAKLISRSQAIFKAHQAVKIAVIGSYGKTTMKELLLTILSKGKKTVATPGNMNTAFSQARFALKLAGDEEVIIVEFGEGQPGDVMSMTTTIQPNHAVVTGLAPNHLDHYPSLDAVAADLLSVDKNKKTDTFITAESAMLQKYVKKGMKQFSAKEVMGWKISDILVSVAETKFTMKKGKKELHIATGLLGRHQVAPIAYGAALADKLGLSKEQIEKGCAEVKPFEHRMQPRYVHGAWLIDDTYNGNLEGLQAGLQLLDELDFKRRWYVTPGLVDQGSETERVHLELGKSIAKANPDIVVLMDNSARPIIEKAMKKHKFTGELRIEPNPLDFYLNLEHVVAAGDLVLMQNDWTDNYS